MGNDMWLLYDKRYFSPGECYILWIKSNQHGARVSVREILITGNWEERFEKAVSIINKIQNQKVL